MDELREQEREEQRKQNVDQQRAYRERKLKQLEEHRNQFVEQQRQYSTNIPVEKTTGDAQHVMVREKRVDNMVQFQEVPITIMVRDKDIEIDDNISAPSEEMYTRHHKFHEQID